MKYWLGIALAGCGSVGDNTKHDAAIDTPRPVDIGIDTPTCVANPLGLGGRWRGEMNTADTGGTYVGTAVGTLSYSPGRHGFAFLLDGSNAVSIDDGDALWAAGSFSLEAYVKTTSTGNVMSKYQCGNACPSGSNAFWDLSVGGGGHATFQLRTDASANIASATDTLHNIDDNQWHHLVGVRDIPATTMTLYVDGQLAVSQPLPADEQGAQTNTDASLDPVIIGGSAIAGAPGVNGFFAGAVDEVSYYSSALTATQVQAIFSAPDGECN